METTRSYLPNPPINLQEVFESIVTGKLNAEAKGETSLLLQTLQLATQIELCDRIGMQPDPRADIEQEIKTVREERDWLLGLKSPLATERDQAIIEAREWALRMANEEHQAVTKENWELKERIKTLQQYVAGKEAAIKTAKLLQDTNDKLMADNSDMKDLLAFEVQQRKAAVEAYQAREGVGEAMADSRERQEQLAIEKHKLERHIAALLVARRQAARALAEIVGSLPSSSSEYIGLRDDLRTLGHNLESIPASVKATEEKPGFFEGRINEALCKVNLVSETGELCQDTSAVLSEAYLIMREVFDGLVIQNANARWWEGIIDSQKETIKGMQSTCDRLREENDNYKENASGFVTQIDDQDLAIGQLSEDCERRDLVLADLWNLACEGMSLCNRNEPDMSAIISHFDKMKKKANTFGDEPGPTSDTLIAGMEEAMKEAREKLEVLASVSGSYALDAVGQAYASFVDEAIAKIQSDLLENLPF